MFDNPDLKSNNSVYSLVHFERQMAFRIRRASGLSDCVEGSWRD
jgi:hypothetical protein